MKNTVAFLVLMLCAFSVYAQKETVVYDSTLARTLGADERGMKSYMLVILKTGAYTAKNKAESDSLFAGHFSNMEVMSDAGKLVMAGPFGKNDKQFRGLFLLNTTSADEARVWLQEDPTIKSGIFDVELIPWYGSAAISTHIDVHKRIDKSTLNKD